MIQTAVEITGSGRRLRKDRGFLVVSDSEAELGRLPLDDLEVVLYAGHGMTCTGEVLNTFAERCIVFIVCDHRFLPASILCPMESHALQSGRIRAQAALSAPLQKRLWQQLVKAKIQRQAEVLERCTGRASPRLAQLAREVRSGDTSNVEGQAAQVYWRRLFGPRFRRDRNASGVNMLLNYGYTVLRAAVARAVMLAGLHPAFGLHHANLRDTMPLLDDLMEPFRPVTDLLIYSLANEAGDFAQLDREAKTLLTTITAVDMLYKGVTSPVSECLLRMTRSLAEVCEGKKRRLRLPEGLQAANAADDEDGAAS